MRQAASGVGGMKFDPPLTRKEWLFALACVIPAGLLGWLAVMAVFP